MVSREEEPYQCMTEFQTETEDSQVDVQEYEKESFCGKAKSRPGNGNAFHSENLAKNFGSSPTLRRQSQEAKIVNATEEMLKDKEKPKLFNQDYEPNTKFERIFNESPISNEIPRNKDMEYPSTVADNLLSCRIQNSISEVSGDADDISREIFLQEQVDQQRQMDSFGPQPVKSNEEKGVQEQIANYGLCNSQENINENRSSEPSSVVNSLQSPKTSHSFSLDFPTIIDSHTSQKYRGPGNVFKDVHQTCRRAESIRGDAIDILREKESFQAKRISGGEILNPLDLSTRSQSGGLSFSYTLTFEKDAIDILREKESFQAKRILGGENPEPLDLSTRSQAGSPLSITLGFEEVKTRVAEPNSLSALQESTYNFGIIRSKNQEGKNAECFDKYSVKSQSNFKELEPEKVLLRRKEITPKELTQRSCHRNSRGRLSACEKAAKWKEGNRIAAKRYRLKKKIKLQELEETIKKLKTLHRGESLQ
ncbi:hypothetical protein QYM36_001025 [Artemia franciscana]|uniref:BZIP domain-containing protein n=1 Tax=Artemia franciscana TaxID=6661 RepID=A0AA88IMA8_ARTSF|nr:hypothetical protein QYM36_001025 [Artemia franciscana]